MKNAFDKLNQIKPRSPTPVEPNAGKVVDEVSQKHGFVADDAPPQRQYRRRPGEKSDPTVPASMRVSVDSWNAFVAWCNSERLTYREAFDLLWKKGTFTGRN